MTSTLAAQDGAAPVSAPGVAVLAGGSAGIGAAIAERLASQGRPLAVLDINPEVSAVSEQVAAKYGVPCAFFECDLADSASVRTAFSGVVSALGEVTALVHNAGWTPYAKFLETTEADEERVLDINLRGFLRMCRQVLPAMVERGEGRIVIVSSDAAKIGVPGEAIYSGAKAGLVGFGKALAAEMARHQVTVNVVSPGSTDSPMLRQLFNDAQIEKRRKANPMRRLASPEDVAVAVGFFLEDTSSYITGQVLSVNGGQLRAG
jgi:2-hydroxycyclohexanecarboxyl-CoA dehydrogenase